MSLEHIQYTVLNTQQNMGINTYVRILTYMYTYIETHNIHIMIGTQMHKFMHTHGLSYIFSSK